MILSLFSACVRMSRRRNARNSCTILAARGGVSTALFALLLLYWRLVFTTIRLHQDEPIVKKHLPKVPGYEFRKSYEQKHRTNNDTTDMLEFIHITKTGGTAVERAAAQVGIPWGVCHYEARQDICNHVRPNLAWPQTFSLRTDIPYATNFTHAEYWHTPPHWFVDNPYSGKDTFTIVRNPYDRYISEYYCPYFGYYSRKTPFASNKTNLLLSKSAGNTNDLRAAASDRVARFQQLANERTAFEQRRRDSIQKSKGRRRRLALQTDNNSSMEKENERKRLNKWLLHRIRNYQGLTGHLLPQYHYVYDTDGNQVVTHVLKFESLRQEFDPLMKRYNLNIALPTHHINSGYTNGKERLTRNDLSKQVIQVINDFCRLDFERFGYDMMDPSLVGQIIIRRHYIIFFNAVYCSCVVVYVFVDSFCCIMFVAQSRRIAVPIESSRLRRTEMPQSRVPLEQRQIDCFVVEGDV